MRRFFWLWGIVTAAIVGALGTWLWWVFTPDHAFKTRRTVQVVADDAEARRLIAAEEKAFPESARERMAADGSFPAHVEFLSAMGKRTGTAVAPESYVRVIEKSKAACEANPRFAANYVKVRVTSGEQKGVEGWLCSEELDATVESRDHRREPLPVVAAQFERSIR